MIGIGTLILLGTTALLGCPEAEQMMAPVVSEQADTEMPSVTVGEVKEPADTEMPSVIEISYYADSDFTEPIVNNEVVTGTVIYTKVVFPKKVPIVIADDRSARPRLFTDTGSHRFQYRMKPRHGDTRDLWGGDAKPYGDAENAFICKYTIREDDAGSVFSVFVNNKATSGSVLSVIALVCHNNLPLTNVVEFTPADNQGDGEDFVGQVVGLTPMRNADNDSALRSYAKPISGAMVTIMSGPRSGDGVITDTDGRYTFANITGDELHLRVEKECFEPKEAIVHRSLPTTLPNRIPLGYQEDPQENPGVILIGQAWPEGIHEVLQQTVVVNDLLFMRTAIQKEHILGFYNPGSGIAAVNYDVPFIFHTTVHEIGHAHQHAMVSLDGSGAFNEWENTPEGRAFAEARRRDWDEFGKFFYDNEPHFSSLNENGAETFATWWSDKLRQHQGRVFEDLTLEENAPHRYRWAEEWLNK